MSGRMTRLLRRAALRQDGGATAVEFALLVPFVLALITGLLLLGFRSVYVALAQNAAKDAVQTAVLPAAGTRALSSAEVCDRALDAVPEPFRPPARTCNGGTAPTAASGLAVEVCPPACTSFSHASRCTALPAVPAGRVRGLSAAAPQALPRTFFTRSPQPSPSEEPPPPLPPAPEAPAPSVTPPSSVGATLSPDPVPVPQPPAVTPQASASAGAGAVLPSATASLGVGVEASASASPALPGAPRPSPSPRRPCTDEREGRLVAVSVTWRVGALEALSGVTLGLLSEDLATVRGTATGRRE